MRLKRNIIIITLLSLFFYSFGDISSTEWNFESSDAITKNIVLGKFTPSKESSFTIISNKYLTNKNRRIYIQKDTYKAFMKMYIAASKDGVTLKIRNGIRTFGQQKTGWENKFSGNQKTSGIYIDSKLSDVEKVKILLRYNAMPGTSRHHWGTDIDLLANYPEFWETKHGRNIYVWLEQNAHKYGFYQPYSKGRNYGYKEEKWHWSYEPLAKKYLSFFINHINYKDITGFKGSNIAKNMRIIDKYVLGIDSILIPKN